MSNGCKSSPLKETEKKYRLRDTFHVASVGSISGPSHERNSSCQPCYLEVLMYEGYGYLYTVWIGLFNFLLYVWVDRIGRMYLDVFIETIIWNSEKLNKHNNNIENSTLKKEIYLTGFPGNVLNNYVLYCLNSKIQWNKGNCQSLETRQHHTFIQERRQARRTKS